MPVRIRRVMEQMNLSREQAERVIRDSDHKRAAFVQQTFGRNIDEDGAYDLIIYTDDLSTEGTARIIHTAVLVMFPEVEKSAPTHALVQKR
jgi:cytidylate kinase